MFISPCQQRTTYNQVLPINDDEKKKKSRFHSDIEKRVQKKPKGYLCQ